jgi:hypothetical protein
MTVGSTGRSPVIIEPMGGFRSTGGIIGGNITGVGISAQQDLSDLADTKGLFR